MSYIAVVGSINLDLVVTSDRIPLKGETIFGTDFQTIPGGKGANQAVAIARFGGNVKMLGCVGSDPYGTIVKDNLKQNQADVSHISTVPGSTGIAVINVSEEDNRIIVVSGANAAVSRDYIARVQETILKADLVLLQNEIPLETTEIVIRLCCQNQIPVMLNPAPAVPLSDEVIRMVTYLTPNEHEVGILFGDNGKSMEELLREYPNKLIVTRGKKGTMYCDGTDLITVPSIEARVVDTTGAGDTFCGVLAQCIVEGKCLREAVKTAQYASGLSVEKFGAQTGMPTREEVIMKMKSS